MSLTYQLKRLSKDTFFYGLGNAINRFINFLLFPIYTRLLTTEDFGAQDLIFTAINIINHFLVLGLDSATARHYYDADAPKEKNTILSTWLWFEMFVSIPVTILLTINAQAFCQLIFKNPSLAPYFQLGVISFPFILISSVTMLTLRLTFKSKQFAIVSFVGVLANALTAIYFVVLLGLGIKGVFYAYIAANIFRAIFGLALTYQNFHFAFSSSWLKPMLSFGIPLVPASLSIWVLNYANRYFLINYGGLNAIGLMGVANRITNIITFAITAFQMGWGPFAYSLIKDEKLAKMTYAKVLTIFLVLLLSSTAGISVLAREIIAVLATSKYEASKVAIPFLSISSVAWGAFYIVCIGYGIAKKSYHTTIAVALAALFTLLANILFIPKWGILGASIATLLGNLIALIYAYLASQHYFKVNYEYKRLGMLVLLTIAAIALGIWADATWTDWSLSVLLIKTLILIGYGFGLFLFKIIELNQAKLAIYWGIERLRGSRLIGAKHNSKPA